MGAKEGHAHYRCGIYNDTCHDKKKKKHALIDNVCMTIQLYDKYLVKYIMIFLQSILNMSYTG
jgi:hypothetical protein